MKKLVALLSLIFSVLNISAVKQQGSFWYKKRLIYPSRKNWIYYSKKLGCQVTTPRKKGMTKEQILDNFRVKRRELNKLNKIRKNSPESKWSLTTMNQYYHLIEIFERHPNVLRWWHKSALG